MAPGVQLVTFGCRANQYDTERIRQELEGAGWVIAAQAEDAGAVVINTCTVTARADAEAARLIRKLRSERPDLPIVVAGCSAARYPERYGKTVGASGVVAGHDPSQVRSSLESVIGTSTLTSLQMGRPPREPQEVAPVLLERRMAGTRGWLKIQDGCDRKCSFCATRLARGVSRSRPPEAVLAEARQLAEHHPELAITGIHIGHYGHDLAERTSLGALVLQLLEAIPHVRLRLGSMEATEVDDALFDALTGAAGPGGRLAAHLHMPLQSGADPVLRRMRRWYTREDYRQRALEIAEALPILGLGADIITGFPGETDADHRDTVRLVEELPFTYLHVFPFSPREGTVAAELALEMPIPQRVAADRARELRELGQAKGEAYLTSRVGASVDVVVERERPDGTALGLTGDYLRLPVEGAGGQPPASPPRLLAGVITRLENRTFVRVADR